MNWEDSKACTPLKLDILQSWFSMESRYFLTGGSALGIFYLHHRLSYDLDLFTTESINSKEVQNLVHQVSVEIGAHYESIRTSPDFHRYKITRGDDVELIDIVSDHAPQLDKKKELVGGIRVDTLREMTANKLTTLLSRTEVKDVVDLFFLEQAGHDVIGSLPDAAVKDGGWDPAMAALLLESLDINKLPFFLLKDLNTDDFKVFVQRLRLAIAEQALP